MHGVCGFILMLSLAACLQAQGLPARPQPTLKDSLRDWRYAGLAGALHGVAAADMYYTVHDRDLWRRYGLYPGFHEGNPVARQFVGNKVLWNGAGQAYLVGVHYAGHRMKTSRNWTRKVWWVPHAVLIGLHVRALRSRIREHQHLHDTIQKFGLQPVR